jgi:hypothetical protein
MAYGRERARNRLRSGRWAPHPGWRNFIDAGWRVLVTQPEALARIEALVDAEEWRTDKRRSWTLILRRLAHAMDWDTGLITGLTAARLGDAGDRAARTVSRVLAWARDIGFLVVVEPGASAEFLGTDTNRTPTYALVTNSPAPAIPSASAQLTEAVDESGDLPDTHVSSKPLTGGRRPTPHQTNRWPSFAVPDSPTDRSAATATFLQRLGLGRRGVSEVPLWRTRALLKPWWDAGMCVQGVLYALDHHPDRPDVHRGDAMRGARDPLRVIGSRLQPWRGRLNALPASVVGHHRDYLTRGRDGTTPEDIGVQVRGGAGRAAEGDRSARDEAKAAVAAHLETLRRRRRLSTGT